MDGGILSQDEINALLSGMDLSGNSDSESSQASGMDEVSSGMDISPSSGESNEKEPFLSGTAPIMEGEDLLTDVEKDAIGEVANISMGSSATTLYSLVNRKVNITTPVVTLATWDTLLEQYEKPCVFIQIKYTKGLDGTNIMVLKEDDVKVITDLMMGGDGTNIAGELGELHLSAISEAMNQMMGAAATSLSTMLKTTIDISPPTSSLLNLEEYKSGADISAFLGGIFVKISFRMQIDDLVDSTIMQLYPVDFAKKLVESFIDTQMNYENNDEVLTSYSGVEIPTNQVNVESMGAYFQDTSQPLQGSSGSVPQGNPTGMGTPQMGMPQMGMPQMDASQMGMSQMGMNMGMPQMGMPQMGMPQMGTPQMGMPQMGMPQMGMPQMGMPQMGMPQMGMPQNNVNVQPAQFQTFSPDLAAITGQENINLIMDVPLEVTVELGRTTKNISDILNFSPGTIIELNRIAGEPVDVLVNGKFVAKGEVVVIEENFSIRITEIIK